VSKHLQAAFLRYQNQLQHLLIRSVHFKLTLANPSSWGQATTQKTEIHCTVKIWPFSFLD